MTIKVAPNLGLMPNPTKRRNPKRRSRSRRASYGANPALLANQRPFSRANLMSFGVAAAGTGIGLVIADFLDRWIATRRPADSESPAGTANHPWYGRDAAAAQNRRPDAMRLGGQAAGAVGSMGLAYLLRGRAFFPWLLGGAALGFGSNLVKMLVNWWLMPAVLPVQVSNEATFANRMYPLEQKAVQDAVDAMFTNWAGVPTLAEAQLETPIIQGPLPVTGGGESSVYALGRANAMRQFNAGRVGQTQPQRPNCRYTVQAGDDLGTLLGVTGVPLETVNTLNGCGHGCGPETYWREGNAVVLPYECGIRLEQGPIRSAVPAYSPGFDPMFDSPQTFQNVQFDQIDLNNGGNGFAAGAPPAPPAPQPSMVAAPATPAPQQQNGDARRAFLNFGAEDAA